jgi:mycothiol synthase
MNAQIDSELPQGFTVRGATLNDVEIAMNLYNRWSNSMLGRNDFDNVDTVRNEWTTLGLDLAEDVRLVFAPNGDLAGYIEVSTHADPPVHPELWARIDPGYQGLGIATYLMHWAEARALLSLSRVPGDLRFSTRVGAYRKDANAGGLFKSLGYQYQRTTYHMLIEVNAPVPEPQFPSGITLRTYTPITDTEPVYRANTESFRDHFGFLEQPFQEGLKKFKQRWEQGNCDASLMFLAMDGDEIAGLSLCRPMSPYDHEMGWVGSLGVRRPWRKRGLGLALLRHSFNEFYRRGKRKVGLGVDAQNLTGALRLYENAGMHVDQAYDYYEKELRPGTEISVQSLS